MLPTLLCMFSCLFCFSQDVTLNSQADVDAFDDIITNITGFLRVETTSDVDPITDLANLSNLTSVRGNLEIEGNATLTNIDGLANLATVGGALNILSNDGLTNLDGLANLETIGEDLWISFNDGLTNIGDFPSLTSIGGQARISSNNMLTNINGFLNLTHLDGRFDISSNDMLTNIDDFPGIALDGGLLIHGNPELTNIDGLGNITSIDGDLTITHNAALTNLDAFSSHTTIGGNLTIKHNTALMNLDDLVNLTTIGGGLFIQSHVLTNIDGLANVTTIGGRISIGGAHALTNLDGLANITTVGGRLDISFNTVLTNLDGLANINTISGALVINDNTALTNIDGLTNVNTISGEIEIYDNAALTNLDGLYNLDTIGEYLRIYNNALLSNCCAIQDLISIPNAIGGFISIYDNPSECSSTEEITAASCFRVNLATFVPCIGATNGAIQLQIRGGIAPFTYTLERIEDGQIFTDNTMSPNFTIDQLGTGTYNLTLSDGEGKVFTQDNIVLTPIPGSVFEIVELTTTNSSNGFTNGAIHLTVAGGTAPYTLTWMGLSSGSQNNLMESTFTISTLAQGAYEIHVSDAVGNQQTVAITLLDEIVPIFPCTQPLDIVILNDVSGSVDAVEYEESKRFFVDFLTAANIGSGNEDSRAAIIEWSGRSEQNIRVSMTDNLEALQGYVTYSRVFDGYTHPHDALNFGENYLASIARPDAERVLVLSTDASSDQISPSLIALADTYKAAGYHIVTIAFDGAFSNNYTRDILRQVASIDLLAPGAPAYSLLDQNLAENIVNLYLCPIDPGSSATAYFNRDGAIQITDIEAIGGCPTPANIVLTFSIEALQELSIPSGTPVTFYHNDPTLFSATSILNWVIPCAIPVGTSETFTVTLPVTTAADIFAVLNDDGSQSPPIAFPITSVEELAWSNNISETAVCLDPLPALQALKYTTTPRPICNHTVIYTVDVCNITDLDATGVVIIDEAPPGFVLLHTVVNDNGCATHNNGSFDIPGSCCVSVTYTYDTSNAAYGQYDDQDVQLSGDINQIYLPFDGATTPREDVIINGTTDCPSMEINFSKTVNTTEICEDGFVVYTFTIDNQLNLPLQGLSISDVLPSPVTWVFEPYNLQGLSISHVTLVDGNANFLIDEVQANTTASFSMDAALGDWLMDGILSSTANLGNVPDLENGTLQTLTSNPAATVVLTAPEITLSQSFNCADSTIVLSTQMNGQIINAWSWISTGDGYFIDNEAASTSYKLGVEDLQHGETTLSVASTSTCGETNEALTAMWGFPTPTSLILETCAGETVDYAGIALSVGDKQDFIFRSSWGCDSVVTVNIQGLPTNNSSLIMETCPDVPLSFDGALLSVGDSQVFEYKNEYGCDSIITLHVVAKEQEGTIAFPNIFSPNDDGINDCFVPYPGHGLVLQDYELQIFNRWGDHVFSTADPLICWEGKSNGKRAETGVYVWFVKFSSAACEDMVMLSGDVVLMR